MERGEEQIRIRGILLPVEWDADGNAIRAAVFAVDEDEYLIEENAKGKRLLGLMKREVEVRGMVREEFGQKTITVVEYRKVKPEAGYKGKQCLVRKLPVNV